MNYTLSRGENDVLEMCTTKEMKGFPIGRAGPRWGGGGVGGACTAVCQGKEEEKSALIKPFINTFHKELHFTLTIAREVVTSLGLFACIPHPFFSMANFSLGPPFLHFQSMGEAAPTA